MKLYIDKSVIKNKNKSEVIEMIKNVIDYDRVRSLLESKGVRYVCKNL